MKPTAAMITNARAALDVYDNGDRGLRAQTASWMVRFARTITRDEPGTPRPTTAARVRDWFDDNEGFRSTDGFFAQTTEYSVAWDMLGGDAGREWARRHAAAREASVGDVVIELDDAADRRELEAGAEMAAVVGRPLVREDFASEATFNTFEGRRPEWAGVLTLEGVETSDNRMIAEGGLTWRDLPITLQDQLLSQPGHDGAVAAGPITNIFRAGREIRGEGFFDSGKDGEDARRRMSEGTKQGVSVDLTEVVLDLPDDPESLIEILMGDGLLLILAARIGAATLVSIPAFEGARLQIVGDLSGVDDGALVASAGALPPDVKLTVIIPIDTIEAPALTADGSPADPDPVVWTSVTEYPEGSRPADADADGGDGEFDNILLEVDNPDPDSIGRVKLADLELYVPVKVRMEATHRGDVIELTPSLVSPIDTEGFAAAVERAWAEATDGNTTDLFDEPAADAGLPTEGAPKGGIEFDRSLVASAGGVTPDARLFDRIRYDGPMPCRIVETSDGVMQIEGHVALWGSCHIGFSGRCVDVPRGLDYGSYQGPNVPNEVLCSDGSIVKAGPVVMDTVHPSLKAVASDAAAHYADTGSLVAQARLYEDEHGLQIRGWILPHVSDSELALLRAADLSPDWRPRANANGSRGVVAVLAVPVSGFNLGLVASGGPDLWAEAEGEPLATIAIVGTNWTPQASELARRKVSALERTGQYVPSDVRELADSTEDPAVTKRKSTVLARLAGESCGCGGSCCT